MINDYPYTNFHDLNLDWLIKTLRSAVYKVNNTEPDADGNVNLAGVSGVTSVNGIGADGAGNIQLTPADLGAIPTSALNQSAFIMTPVTDNLLGTSYISGIKNSVLSVMSIAAFFDTCTLYQNVSDFYRIPMFTVAGNIFGFDTETLATTPLSFEHFVGPIQLTGSQNVSGVLLYVFYDGTDTIVYAVTPALSGLPDGGTSIDQRVKLM